MTSIAILAALIVAVAPLAACTSAYGRHNPTVTVEIGKAPRLGFPVEEVVFAPPELSPPSGADERADAAVSAWIPGHDVTAPDFRRRRLPSRTRAGADPWTASERRSSRNLR